MKNKLVNKINIKLLVILLVIICFRAFVYNKSSEYTTWKDTETYINYDANILKGEVNSFRTPIYPYILKFVSIFNTSEISIYKNTTYLQEIVSIISVIILYITLEKTFKNQITSSIATVAYGCMPAIFTYNRVILTESLSISLFVMYFCLVLKYLKEPTNKKTIFIGLFTIFLIFLRPSFIYLIIALAIMFILIFIIKKEYRKQAVLGGGVLIFIGLTILGYSYLNKLQNGFFGMSTVTQNNQLDIILQMGIYNTKDIQDEGIINIIEQRLDGNMVTWYTKTLGKIQEEYTTDEIADYIGRCIKNNFKDYVVGTTKRIFKISLSYCDEVYLGVGYNNLIKPVIPFIIIYLYLLFEVIYIIVKGIRNRKIFLQQFMMLILVLGQLATIILSAQAEYSRLFIASLPIVIILVVWNIDDLITWYNADTIEKLDSGKEAKNEI